MWLIFKRECWPRPRTEEVVWLDRPKLEMRTVKKIRAWAVIENGACRPCYPHRTPLAFCFRMQAAKLVCAAGVMRMCADRPIRPRPLQVIGKCMPGNDYRRGRRNRGDHLKNRIKATPPRPVELFHGFERLASAQTCRTTSECLPSMLGCIVLANCHIRSQPPARC